jgi:hypothetical protein
MTNEFVTFDTETGELPVPVENRITAIAGDGGGGGGVGTVTAVNNVAPDADGNVDITATDVGAQPVDSDLTAVAALNTTAYGRAFLELANAAAGRTALGLGTAATSAITDFQPADSDLDAIAQLATTAYGRSLLTQVNAPAARTALGLGTAATVNTGTTSGTVPVLGTGGTLPIARLATGTPNGTKFVRDDGTLATPAGSGTVTSVSGVSPDGTGNVTLTAANVGAIPTTDRANNNGVAPLSNAKKVPPVYLALAPGAGKILQLDDENTARWVLPGGTAQNVLDFGADRTGVNNSSNAFNAAIAASLNATGGLAVAIEVPAGQFIFDSPVNPVVDVPVSIHGAGYRATTLLATSAFHANYPGRYLLHLTGTGTSDGQVQIRQMTGTGTFQGPVTAPFSEITEGPYRGGYDSVLGNDGAAATVLIRTGSLVGAGTLTVNIDQSDDPLFGSGVTTTTLTFNETESNVNKDVGNAGIAPYGGKGFWVANYFRVRYSLTGTPTSWPIQITYNNDYNVLTGVDLAGFAVNAAGSPTAGNITLGMDADGRWNTKGIFIDRAKWVDMRNVWVNKARGQGIRLREVWDSSFTDLKVLKSGDPTGSMPAMSCEPFNAWVTGSNTNNSTFTQVHLEDNKYTQLYIGRRSRRLRWFGLKCHGDLASNSVMTTAPHIRMESAYTNQFFGLSMNRAGGSHVEMDIHAAEAAQITSGEDPGHPGQPISPTASDRNAFIGCYFDSSRTNTSVAPSNTPSVNVLRGSFNRWVGCTWSSNVKAASVATGVGNVDNFWAEDNDFHDLFAFNGTQSGTIATELTGPVRAMWYNPALNKRYLYDGTTLTEK